MERTKTMEKLNFNEFNYELCIYCNSYTQKDPRIKRNFDNRFICIQRDGSEPRHTCAYTCPIYIRVCVVEEKKKKGRTPSAKHLLRPPLLNDFTHCASKYQPLVFRGSLCRDDLNIKATMVNVTRYLYHRPSKFHFHLSTYVSHITLDRFAKNFHEYDIMRGTFNHSFKHSLRIDTI